MELLDFNRELWDYIEAHSTSEDKVLTELTRYTHLKVVHPRMLSGPIQGKFLEFLSRMICPEQILEIGTYTGYSAICLARGLKEGGILTTIEINDEFEPVSTRFFTEAGLENKINLVHGDALDIIPKLQNRFDLVFMDAEKEQYPDYYDLVFPTVKNGGFIIADNTLWDGKVLNDRENTDPASQALRSFNAKIRDDSRVENIILPLRDGLTLIRKLQDSVKENF